MDTFVFSQLDFKLFWWAWFPTTTKAGLCLSRFNLTGIVNGLVLPCDHTCYFLPFILDYRILLTLFSVFFYTVKLHTLNTLITSLASVYKWGFLNICCTKYKSRRPPIKAGKIKVFTWTLCSHYMQSISVWCWFGIWDYAGISSRWLYLQSNIHLV